MNKEIIKVRTVADVAISSALLVLGIVLVALPTAVSVSILGFFTLVVGALLLAVLKSGWQDAKTKERYCKKEVFFHQGSKDKILHALEHRTGNIELSEDDRGEGMRMEIYYSKQSRKAFVTLFEYVPYSYEPVSPTVEYTVDEIAKLVG